MGIAGRICFITDRGLIKRSSIQTKDLYSIVSIALDSGIRWIQFREKTEDRASILREAMRLKKLTSQYEAALTINDHTDIAVIVEAEGLHLGQEDMPIKEARKIAGNKIIGISTHSIKEALDAEREGADYIGFGPVFATETKNAGLPKGVALLREIKRYVKIPVVAIGGIKVESLASVFEAGADAVAVASGLILGDIRKNIKSFLEIAGSA